MSGPFDPPTQPGALPVLTEELEHPAAPPPGHEPAPAVDPGFRPSAAAPLAELSPPGAGPAGAVVAAAATVPEREPLLDARAIEDEVMAELGQRIDLMFEYRLREALAPTLARAADLLIREAREEVALTLRDVVSRAVAQQLARRRVQR
ncbi:MAG: hypothetical protein RI988_152 [Pseudomonadota bacterium]